MRTVYLLTFIPWACGSPSLDGAALYPANQISEMPATTRGLYVEPNRPLNQVEPVTVVQVELSQPPDTQVTPYIIEGPVSQVSLGKLADGELTSVLADRRLPAVVRDSGTGWRIRPRSPLLSGQIYSVVSAYGLHGTFSVGAATLGYLARVWPAPDSTSGALLGIYCGPRAITEPLDVKLEGSNVRARLLPGLDDVGTRLGRCVRLIWGLMPDDLAQPPTEMSGYAFDPATIPQGPMPDPPATIPCFCGEIPFGPSCAIADSGRIIVRPPAGDSLWALRWEGNVHVQTVRDGERFVIPDLGDRTTVELGITVFDAAGRSQSTTATVALPPPGPRIIINEVLANPIGSEPAQEWIELVNSGTLEGGLRGWTLKDSGKGVALPPVIMAPGEYALIVRDDFDAGLPGDVQPAGPVQLIRVPQLGQSGLSNAGEALSLIDASGNTVSRFPAVETKIAGVSVARRAYWSLDDDPDAFAYHGGVGASPGVANYFDN